MLYYSRKKIVLFFLNSTLVHISLIIFCIKTKRSIFLDLECKVKDALKIYVNNFPIMSYSNLKNENLILYFCKIIYILLQIV